MSGNSQRPPVGPPSLVIVPNDGGCLRGVGHGGAAVNGQSGRRAADLPGLGLATAIYQIARARSAWPEALAAAVEAVRERENHVRRFRHGLDQDRTFAPIEVDWLKHATFAVEVACSTAAATLGAFAPQEGATEKPSPPSAEAIFVIVGYVLGSELFLDHVARLCRFEGAP